MATDYQSDNKCIPIPEGENILLVASLPPYKTKQNILPSAMPDVNWRT